MHRILFQVDEASSWNGEDLFFILSILSIDVPILSLLGVVSLSLAHHYYSKINMDEQDAQDLVPSRWVIVMKWRRPAVFLSCSSCLSMFLFLVAGCGVLNLGNSFSTRLTRWSIPSIALQCIKSCWFCKSCLIFLFNQIMNTAEVWDEAKRSGWQKLARGDKIPLGLNCPFNWSSYFLTH